MTTPNQPSKRLAVAERRQKVAAGIRRGRTLADLAQELQVDPSTISRDVKAIESSLRERAIQDVVADRALQRQRLESAVDSLWPAVDRGEVPAIRTLVRVIDRIARLDGLDAPVKVEQTVRMHDQVRELADREGLDFDSALAEAERYLRQMGRDAP